MVTTATPPSDIGLERPSLLQLFLAFLRLGVTAFGGPAMVAYIGEMAVQRMRWLSRESFMEGVAVAQAIPGATAMQVAAAVGLRSRGVSGAAAAYLGFGLPAFVLMVVLSAVYSRTHGSPISLSVFQGLQVIVVAIVGRATVIFGRATTRTWQDAAIGLLAAAYLAWGGSPIVAIAVSAAMGLLLFRTHRPLIEGAQPSHAPRLASTTRLVLAIVLIALAGVIVLGLFDRRLFDLSLLMARIDLLAFGGGFASVPIMLHEVVAVRQWMSTSAFMDGIAMGQVTPGPIVITATFIGYQLRGLAGAVVATAAIFLPSFIILALVLPRFDRVKSNPWFQHAMRGILAGFVGLLLAVTLKFGLAVSWTPVSALLAAVAFTALMLRVDVPWVVLPGAILSAFLFQ